MGSNELKCKREFTMNAAGKDGMALHFAFDELKRDRDVVTEASGCQAYW